MKTAAGILGGLFMLLFIKWIESNFPIKLTEFITGWVCCIGCIVWKDIYLALKK